MGQEFVNENGNKQDGGGRQQSAPRAIACAPNAAALESSSSASPHWPRSYERSMEVYSRSLSRRSRSLRADSFNTGLEPSLSEQFAAAVDRAEADLKTPLLPEEKAADLESQSKELELHEDEEHVQGSSFLQSLFNGMNILAGSPSFPSFTSSVLFFSFMNKVECVS